MHSKYARMLFYYITSMLDVRIHSQFVSQATSEDKSQMWKDVYNRRARWQKM